MSSGGKSDPPPKIKVELVDTAADSQQAVREAVVTPTGLVRRLFLQFEKSTPTTSPIPSPTKMTVESLRAQVEVKTELIEADFVELENLLKQKDPKPSRITGQVQCLRVQVDKITSLRESLGALLLKDNKKSEWKTEIAGPQGKLMKKFIFAEGDAEELLKKKAAASANTGELTKTTPIDIAQIVAAAVGALEAKLEHFEQTARGDDDEDLGAEILAVQIQWAEFEKRAQEHLDFLRSTGNMNDYLLAQQAKSDLQQRTMKAEADAHRLLHKEAPPPPPPDPNAGAFRHNRRDLPKLTGHVKDWLPFWGFFQDVDQDTKLSSTHKFQLLLQSTEEGSEARAMVEAYVVAGKNYAAALAHLKDLYGRENVLIKVYVRELLQLALDRSFGKTMKFRDLVTSITTQITNMEMLGVTADKSAIVLYPIIEACLPQEILATWQRHPDYCDELGKLTKFLQTEVKNETERNLAQFQFQPQTKQKEGRSGDRKAKGYSETPTPTAAFHTKVQTPCIFCNYRHPSAECKTALHPNKLSYEEKEQLMIKAGACFVCLEIGHLSPHCPNRAKVKCTRCSKNHFRVVCRQQQNGGGGGRGNNNNNNGGGGAVQHQQQPNSNNNPVPGSSANVVTEAHPPAAAAVNPPTHTSFKTSVSASKVPLQIIPLTLTGAGGRMRVVQALLDTGSQKSYIIDELQQDLNFPVVGEEEMIHQVFGGTTLPPRTHQIVKLFAGGSQNKEQCTFDVTCIPKISDHVPAPTGGPWIEEFRQRGVHFNSLPNSTAVEVLIGNDVVPRLYTGRIEDLGTGPVAMETRWGWVLCGKLPQPHTERSITMTTITSTLLDLPITALWDLETIGIRDAATTQSKEELAAQTQQHFLGTVKREADGRYQVQLPFLAGSRDLLPTQFYEAEGRLMSTTTNLRKKGVLQQYGALFKQWEEDKMIEEVPLKKNVGHYLPHQAVIKLSSSTTPIRPVFDASAKSEGKPSLNDCLEKGPNLLELIPTLLTRFRMDRVGVTADVKKAFQQISVAPEHRDYLKFLWWADPECTQLKAYRHTRVVFGVSSSPFLLGATLNHHLDQSPSSHEETAQKLKMSLYVDNVVASLASMEEAEDFKRQSRELLDPAHFDLRGWEFGPKKGGETMPILGMGWDTGRDTLALELGPALKEDGGNTQRAVLSLANMLFDPLGIISPFSLKAKMILRKCHEMKLGWKKPLPPLLQQKFNKWKNQIPQLKEINIPRFMMWTMEGGRSLHIFCDASSSAYAAVAYLRIQTPQEVRLAFVQAKARIAPKDCVSIPRLELVGCLIGSRLGKSLLEDLGNVPITYWTDSSTALAWITGEGPWAVFVQNRVNEIRKISSVEQWRHVPGKFNPADLPSRGGRPAKISEMRFLSGPEWLISPPHLWPATVGAPIEEEVRVELKKTIATNTVVEEPYHSMQKFWRVPDYWFMVRAIAIWIEFRSRLRQQVRQRKDQVAVLPLQLKSWGERREEAELDALRYLQRNLMDDPGRLKKLRPFKDEKGILRTRTRLVETEEIAIFPIILPDKEEGTWKIVRDVHERNHHIGPNLLMGKLREKFWLLNARREVCTVLGKCWICRRWATRPIQVAEPPLPITRTGGGVPFNVVGVDLAGPLYLKKNLKVHVALFTCANYRAVHLEVVDSQSTDDFFHAFRKFVARRGRPSIVYSDNAKNFIGADAALQTVYQKEAVKFAQERQIDWRFNAPNAPWWGGWWERLIGLMKQLMRRVLEKKVVHRKQLEIVLLEIEDALNNRPLTHLSDNPDDPIPLTPNMLVRNSGLAFCPALDIRDATSARAAYRRIQGLQEALSSRFRKEYLAQLSFQRKEKEFYVSVKPGDVVLVEKENAKRHEWALGVVLEVIAGRDGVARTFRVKTPTGISVRPAQRLYPMELAEAEEEEKQN